MWSVAKVSFKPPNSLPYRRNFELRVRRAVFKALLICRAHIILGKPSHLAGSTFFSLVKAKPGYLPSKSLPVLCNFFKDLKCHWELMIVL